MAMEMSDERRGECCMCGDYGLSMELFRCKVCLFRSQHRYCSNLYPKAELYRVCNWCLSRETVTPISSDSNSSMSSKKSRSEGDMIEKKKMDGREFNDGWKGRNRETAPAHKTRGDSNKERSPEKAIRKRIITRRELEEKLRRTRAGKLLKQQHGGFRNKVRRYKLLDEVSS